MNSSYVMHTARHRLQQQQQEPTINKPGQCTCGAQAFRDRREQHRQRQHKRVTPMGTTQAKTDAMSIEKHNQRSPPEDDEKDEELLVSRKRSLWRKLLGKAPKCICEKLQKEREANRPKPIPIPSEYEGCVSVRVAGKQVAYTREMQLIKRRSYTPMDAISEDEDSNLDV